MSEQHRNSSEFMGWETPRGTPDCIFDRADVTFGPAMLDVAATFDNNCCDYYIGPDSRFGKDALGVDWYQMLSEIMYCPEWGRSNPCAWMNPPYGTGVIHWVRKAITEAHKGMRVIALLSNRSDTEWWHLAARNASNVVFLKGRIQFWIDGKVPVDPDTGKPRNQNTSGSTIFVFDPIVPSSPALHYWDTKVGKE